MASGDDKRKLTVVTSFSPQGYKEYGRDFLVSFRKFWPTSVRLVTYLDASISDDFDADFVLLNEADMPEWAYFYEGIKRFPLMCGQTPGGYSIQYDARMARKTFIEADAVKQYGDKVFWIDADVITHAPVSEDFLDQMLPDDKMSCYLGRDGWAYTESGFLGFNANHPACKDFMAGYVSMFTQGYIFTQKFWHDCMAYDMARLACDPGWFHNLAAWLPHGTMHPFVNSPLGAVMDHRKGPRKSGRSGREDLVVQRTEPYWLDA